MKIPGYKVPRPEEVRERLAEACRQAQPLWEWSVHTKAGFFLIDRFYLRCRATEQMGRGAYIELTEEIAQRLIESGQVAQLAPGLTETALEVLESWAYSESVLIQDAEGNLSVERL